MNITKEQVQNLLAEMLNIDEEDRKPDWFDVLTLISRFTASQKEVQELQAFKQFAEVLLPESIFESINHEAEMHLCCKNRKEQPIE